ncbi:MAG: molybdopterin molybdenumtransferase MoeA [Rhodobacteraceae bacterium]|jgi:molybdopterin molybdotransferase|nr:molybdopterin molybdenumtransferase MoeA [Paracoccaceae bacterium]|tara:strand:- start:305 stop:1480 length:1176 start_codon:yes stop_codon:yes gene_type:complete
MISVTEALEKLFLIAKVTPVETVELKKCLGRVLAKPLESTRSNPPFPSSAMDGYAINKANLKSGAEFKVIGESAAGHSYPKKINKNEAVRIFTGSRVPDGANLVLMQEDVEADKKFIIVKENFDKKSNIRLEGSDFSKGYKVKTPLILGAKEISLLAAMNFAHLSVRKKPTVAIISTGDELVFPGESPKPDQIIASNAYGIAALCEECGAEPRILPIAQDNLKSIEYIIGLAQDADLIITIGGASVGKYDLINEATNNFGVDKSFHKVAMRPGKPLMAGKLNETALVGLPGNPVSALVCGYVFIRPLIQAMLGLEKKSAPRLVAPCSTSLPKNGPREHYMRAVLLPNGYLEPVENQDSARLALLYDADALLIRAAHAEAIPAKTQCEYIKI